MATCKDCGSAFAFHELREERCLSCWHRLSTGNPLPANAKAELTHKVAMLEEELSSVKREANQLVRTIEAHECQSQSCDNDGEENCDCLEKQTAKLKATLAADAGKEQR